MAQDNRILFVSEPDKLLNFYNRLLRLPPAVESEVNGRRQWKLSAFGSQVILRESTKPMIPHIPNGLEFRLPEGITIDEVVSDLTAAGVATERGTSARGVQFVELTDPLGIHWQVRAHSR